MCTPHILHSATSVLRIKTQQFTASLRHFEASRLWSLCYCSARFLQLQLFLVCQEIKVFLCTVNICFRLFQILATFSSLLIWQWCAFLLPLLRLLNVPSKPYYFCEFWLTTLFSINAVTILIVSRGTSVTGFKQWSKCPLTFQICRF